MKTKQQRIAELEAELAKLKAETERTPLGWKPDTKNENPYIENPYHYLTVMGAGTCKDAKRLPDGHVKATFMKQPLYRTREEAERADRIRKNKMEVLRCIEKHNKGWQPDWEDGEQKKYYFYFSALRGGKVFLSFGYSEKRTPDSFIMRSYEVIETVQKEMGNKILALFDMEEGEV